MKKIVVILCFLAVFVTAYCSCAFSFQNRFLPKTTINGISVGQMDAENAEQALSRLSAIQIILREGDGVEVINSKEIDGSCTFEPAIEDLLHKQNPFLLGLALLHPIQETVRMKPAYDPEKLRKAVLALQCLHVTPKAPVNARIVKGEDSFMIEPEINGNQIDAEKLVKTVIEQVNSGNFVIEAEPCYIQPSIRQDDTALVKTLQKLENITQADIRIDMTGATETIPKDNLFQWVSLEKGDIVIDEDAVSLYVSHLEEDYKTYGKPHTFHTSKAGVKELGGLENDTYGFWLDRDATTNIIIQAVKTGQDKTITPIWRVPACTRNSTNGDIGTTYIEIDIDEQMLWYYQNGFLVMSIPVITGKNIDGERTESGVYRILERNPTALIFGWNGEAIQYAVNRTDAEFNDTTTYILNGGIKNVEMKPSDFDMLYKAVKKDIPVLIF